MISKMLHYITVITVFLFSIQGSVYSIEETRACSSNQECTESFEATQRGEIFCCGKCGNGFCCGNETLQIKEEDCPSDPQNTGDLNSSAKMLGVIIGGMVVSFSGAMLLHAVVRKLIQKRRKLRSRNGENGMPVDETPRQYQSASIHVEYEEDLPSYEDIHLYKMVLQQNHNAAAALARNLCKTNTSSTTDGIPAHDDTSDTSLPPPYTISSKLQTRFGDRSDTSTTPESICGNDESSDTPPSQFIQTTDGNTSIPVRDTCSSSTMHQAQASQVGPNSEVLIVKVIDMLKTLESDDNCDNARSVIKSAKNYLKEVVERGDTPKTHSRSSTSCGNIVESYELITTSIPTPATDPDKEDSC